MTRVQLVITVYDAQDAHGCRHIIEQLLSRQARANEAGYAGAGRYFVGASADTVFLAR